MSAGVGFPRWQKIAYAVLAVASLAILLYVADLSRTGFAKQSTSIDASDRSDCRARISATFTEVRDRRENLDASLSQQYARAQLDDLAGIRPTEETIKRYADTESMLEVAILAVEQLPNLATAVDDGWVPSPEARKVLPTLPLKIPRCPTVD